MNNNDELTYKCITFTRIQKVNKYVPHKNRYEKNCDCCDEPAVIRIRLMNLNNPKSKKYKALYLCDDHLKDLKFFINYF